MTISRCVRRACSLWWIAIVAFTASFAVASGSRAEDVASGEAKLRAIGVASAAKYAANPNSYTYKPHADPDERAASTVAITGHILLEAFLATNERRYLSKAEVAALTVLAHPDMNRNDKYGWGRYWSKSEGSPSRPGDGSNTTFAFDCTLERNKAYDDEMYDNARIGHFLLDLYLVSKQPQYLHAVRRMIDDTWSVGETDQEGGFFYYKTVGACDRGWHVRNVNMLMAVPIALLSKITGEARYSERLDVMMKSERGEIRRRVGGSPAPNLGYYGLQTMRERPIQGSYVSRAQTTDLAGPITCNLKTGSGESCTAHLGLEARAIDIVLRISGRRELAAVSDIKTIMAGHEARDEEMCTYETTKLGRPRSATYCAAYYCALRHLQSKYADLCLARARNPSTITPDIVLGLFWGRHDRFPYTL